MASIRPPIRSSSKNPATPRPAKRNPSGASDNRIRVRSLMSPPRSVRTSPRADWFSPVVRRLTDPLPLAVQGARVDPQDAGGLVERRRRRDDPPDVLGLQFVERDRPAEFDPRGGRRGKL